MSPYLHQRILAEAAALGKTTASTSNTFEDALNDIANYCGSDREGFCSDRMRQDATLRKLEVIGQAVKNLPERIKSRQPDIPWKQIACMRDKFIHDYLV